MATEAQTPEPISGKTIEEEIKPFNFHQLHTASGVKAEDPARKAIMTEDENSKETTEGPSSKNVSLLKVDYGHNHPSFETAERSTKTEASQTNSSTLMEIASDSSLGVETVSEKPDGALDVEERVNQIPVENQKANETELKKEQEESTKPDSEAKVTAAIIENKREDTEKPSISSDEKYDDKVSLSLPERRKDDWDQEHTHSIPNEQNLDSTKECNVEAEAVDEENLTKTSDFSINKTGAAVETIDLKYENKHEEMKQEKIDQKYEIKHEEEMNDIEVAKEEEKKEVLDNKLDMLSVSEETEGKMIEESSKVLSEYQNLDTGVDSERLQRSVELGSEGKNLEKIEESDNVGDPSSISGINLDSTSVLRENKETGNSEDFPDLAFEASAMVPEENTDNGSAGATENIKSNVFKEEECVEKHIDTDAIPIKQELTDSCYQEDKIEGKELDETSNIEKNLETSDPCRETESQKLGREENPVSSLKDLSTAETVADPSIQNTEMNINNMNETKYSPCISAHEENILETKNVIQNIEEEVNEEGLSAYDNVQPVSVTIVTEETNLQKAELEDEKLEETSDVASDGIPETMYTTLEQKGENTGEVPKLASEHPPGSDNTDTKRPDLASDGRGPGKGHTTFEQREGENTEEAPKLESEYPPDNDNTDTMSPGLASDGRSPETSYTTLEQKEGENTGEAPKLVSKHPPGSDNADTKSPKDGTPDILPIAQASVKETSEKDKIEGKEPDNETKPIPEERVAKKIEAYDLELDDKTPQVNDTSLDHKEAGCTKIDGTYPIASKLHTTDESGKEDNGCRAHETSDVLPAMQTFVETSSPRDEIQGEENEKSTEQISEEKTEDSTVSNLAFKETIQEADDSGLHQEHKDDQIKESSTAVNELPTADGSENAEDKPDDLLVAQAIVLECIQNDKIEVSGLASEENIIKTMDESLQHGEVKEAKIKECFIQDSKLSIANEIDKTDKESLTEETAEVFPVVQTLVENILEKDEKQSTKKAAKQISEEKKFEGVEDSNPTCEEKIQETDDAILLLKEGEGKELKGTSVSESREVNANKMTNTESSTEVKQDLLPASQPSVKEILQNDEIQGNESKKENETLPEEKTSEAIKISDFSPEEKFPEASDAGLQKEEGEGSKIAETSLVPEHHIFDESVAADKQCQTEKTIDAFPIFAQALVDKSLENDEIQGIEPEKETESRAAVKISEEFEAADLASKEKCPEATDARLQHEDEGVKNVEISHLISEISTVDESNKEDMQIPAEEKADVSQPKQSLQEDEIHCKEPEKAKPIHEQGTAEAATALDIASKEKSAETNSTTLHHKEVKEVGMEEHPNLACELPTVDGSDNADWKPDALPIAQALIQENLEKEKIEASGSASGKNIPEAEIKEAKSKGSFDQVFKLPTANEIDKAGKDCPTEETTDVLPVVQTIVQNILEKDKTKSAKKAAEQISEEKTSDEIKDFDLACEEIIQETDDTILLLKKGEGKETKGTSVNESSEVNENKMTNIESSMEVKQELLHVSESSPKESLQEDETQGKEFEKESETLPQEKISEAIEVSDFEPKERFPELRETSLLRKEAEGSQVVETSTLVSEPHIFDESDNADKQNQTDRKIDAFPIITQAFINESLQKDESFCIESDKATEPRTAAKIPKEFVAYDVASKDKCLEATDASLQHEDEGVKIAEISTVDKNDKVDKQTPAEEKADASEASVEESLQREEIHSKEPEIAAEQVLQQKAAEATLAFGLASEEKCLEMDGNKLHHEEVIEVDMESETNLACEYPTVYVSDNAVRKPDSLPIAQALEQEKLQGDKINASGLACEDNIPKASDKSLQHGEVEDAKIEESMNQVFKLHMANERDKTGTESLTEETTDVLPAVQSLVENILQKDEVQGGEAKKVTEQISEQKKSAEEIMDSNFVCEEKIEDSDDTILFLKEIEGTEIEGTSACEYPEVNEKKMTNIESSTVIKQELLPASEPLLEESLQEDETQGKESEKASEMLPQEKILEVTEASDFEPKEKFLEACDTNLQKEETEGSKIAETSNLVSELHIFGESNNADKQTQTDEKIDTFPIIAQASVDESLQKYEIQGIELEKATEPRTAAKTAEEFEASVLASQEKCPEATDASLQNEDEGAKIVEISHLISKISTVAESDKADMQVPAKEKADALSILPALVDEILQKDEIHFNEPEKADEWISEQKTAKEITAFDIASEEKSQETNREVENLEMEEHANLFCELPLINERNNSDKKSPTEEKTNDLPNAQALVDESLQQDEIQSKESMTGDEAIPKEKTLENLKASGLAYEGKSLTASDASLQHKEAEGTESEETYFVPEISTVNESGKADKQTLTEGKGDPLPIAQALIEESLRNDEIHSKEPERAAEVVAEQKTAEKILLREDVEIKIMNKEECPHGIPSTIAPVDEADKDNRKLGEPLEISHLVSENLGVKSTKAEIDSGIDVNLGEEAPMFTTADTSSTTKDVPTENKRKETNLETSVSIQTTEDPCLQMEAMKSNQVTQSTDSTGDCSNHIQQNNGRETKIETLSMEGSQKEDDEEYEIPKSEPKEHVSEAKDGIEVFEGEIPAKEKESEERIGIVMATCVSTEDEAEEKFEEGHKQEVSLEHDLKAAESSWMLENDTPKDDTTHDFKLNTTSAAQSDVSCPQQEESETQQIEKVSRKVSKDQSQSDTNTESSTTQARFGDNLKTGTREETESERVETPTDNDLEVRIVKTCASAKTYSSEDDEKLLEIEASFKEDKKEKGEEPAATVHENVDRKFKDRGNEGVVVHAEISDASKNSGRETQNNDEALEPNLQEDTLEGAKNEQSLEVVIEGIQSANEHTKEEKDFPENRDDVKRVEESFPDVNQEVKEGTDELEPPSDPIGDVSQNQAMKASDLVTEQQENRVHSTEKKEAEALKGEGLTNTVDTSVNKTISTEESTEIQVGYKHQKATAFTPEEHVTDESKIKLDILVDANYEKPQVDSEPVPKEQSKRRTPEMRSTRIETPTDNESPDYTLADPQASVQENTETEAIQMKTEEHFKEQDERSKSMDGEEPESTCKFNFVDKPEGAKATESKERDMIEKESSSYKGIKEDRTEWEKHEMPSPTVFERVEMACTGENVEKQINPVSFNEVKEERFQEDKFEVVKPEANPHFLNHEMNEANNTTNNDIPNEVPKGLEAEGCVQKLNTVSLRDDKIEDNSKENEDKKVSEPELETEDQIAEMKDTDDKTVDRHSTEEIPKGHDTEESVLELNDLTIRADTVEENLQENKDKKLSENELEAENQIYEMKDTDDETMDGHPTEEIPKGLEAKGSVLELNALSITEDTVEENLQENKDKKLMEPELEAENQICEMKNTDDKTADGHSTEEIPKGLEAEESVLELNALSTRADTVEENLQENKDKKHSEPELEAENQIYEMKDTDDKTVYGHPTEEIPKGLEAVGSVLQLNALSIREDTVEEKLQENKAKKLSEPEQEAKNQICEMKETDDEIVAGHSTEEIPKGLEAQESVLELNTLSTRADTVEVNLQEKKEKKLSKPELEDENQIYKMKDTDDETVDGHPTEEIPKGLEAEGSVLQLKALSIREDTVEENLQENKDKKLMDPELEAKNQICDMKDTDDKTVDGHSTKEIPKGLEAEESVLEHNALSTRADTVEENKDKKLSEPELEAENQIYEMKDTDDETVDGHPTEEIPKGPEAEGSVLQLNALSIREDTVEENPQATEEIPKGLEAEETEEIPKELAEESVLELNALSTRADTVEENLQENKDKKLSEPELEAENHKYEMNDTDDETVDGHPTEEIPKGLEAEESVSQLNALSIREDTVKENLQETEEIPKGLEAKESVMELNALSTRADTAEENLQENKDKKLSEPKLEVENQNYEMNDTDDETVDGHPTEETPKGLEAEGSVLHFNALSIREDTVEENLQENKDKKLSEPELEVENQNYEMNDTNEETVDGHPTEEIPKGLEAEGSVLQLNALSIREDTVEENLQENKDKKLSEPELEVENQNYKMNDTDDETVDGHPSEKIPKGLEAKESVLEFNALSTRADTVEVNLQENKDRKLKEPELEVENQICEMKDADDKTVDGHSTEEIPKGLEAEGSVLELNALSIRADTVEGNLQENKDKKLSEPELEAKKHIFETKGTDDRIVDGHSTEGIPKGLEAEGSVLELNALSIRADTVKGNLQENKDKKLSEPEFQAENQIFETKGTDDRIVDGHSTEEAKRSSVLSTERSNQTKTAFMKDEEELNQIFETSTATVTSADKATKEEVLKGLGGEGAVLKLNTKSIRVDTVEENLEEDREVKKLSEPGLEAENQILHKDTSHNTKDENPNEEIIPDKDSSLLPTEESYQTGPTEKTETVFLKDEEDPNLSINASPVTITLAEEIAKKEVDDKMENASSLELKKQIHEAATANEKSIEFATTKTSAPEGQIEEEKLKESSADFSFIHNSNTVRDAIKLTEPPSIETLGVTDTSPVALASDAKMLQQESEKLYRDSNLVSEEKIQETIDANEVKEMCIVRPEEASCLSSIEQPEEREKAENEIEDPQQLQETSELVSEKRRHEKIKATEVEENRIATDAKPTEAPDENETPEVTDAIPQGPINKTIIAGDSIDQAMEDAQILEIRKLVTGPKASDENIHDNIPASGEIESMILKDEESRNRKFDSILPDRDLEQEKLSNKETKRLEEAKVILQNIEVPNEVSDETSEDNLQTPDVTSSKKAKDEDQWLGEASEVELELKEAKHEEDQMEISMEKKGNAAEDSIEEIKASDSGKILLSDLLQKSTKETLQPAKDFIQERSPICDEDNSQNKQVATVQIEEEKTCEEEDEEEEKDGKRKEESGSDAPVIVEASKDADHKLVHKKPHNILSGVGSKVKHSIAKVRKAITGKSSHHKSQSQK